MSGEGRKFDNDKPRTDLLPTKPLLDIAEILAFGAKKYGERNWETGMRWSRLYGAALRHLWAWFAGEENDKETGRSHLAHAACCVIFLMQYNYTKREFDDRPKVGPAVSQSS